MKVLFFFTLFTAGIVQLTECLVYSHCRPPGEWAINIDCGQTNRTWIQQALFGATTDGGALRNFCDNAMPNRTIECIPNMPQTTRNIRLACNTKMGQCQPTETDYIMTNEMFSSCAGSTVYTYAYAVYDCLPAYRPDESYINEIYLSSPSATSSRTVVSPVYLMSTGYDVLKYTNSPADQCSVQVPSGASLRFTVLDLVAQTTDMSNVACPYTLSINSRRQWCAQPTWNFSDTYVLDIPAGSGSAQTVNVVFSSGSSTAQGRVWIKVDGTDTNGNAVNLQISCGQTTTSTTTTTTTTTPTITSTSATTTTPTTTTTTPTTTTTTTTTTPTTPTTTSTTTSTTTTTTTTPPTTVATTTTTPTRPMTPTIISTSTTTTTISTTTTTFSTTTTTTTSPTTTTSTTTTSTRASSTPQFASTTIQTTSPTVTPTPTPTPTQTPTPTPTPAHTSTLSPPIFNQSTVGPINVSTSTSPATNGSAGEQQNNANSASVIAIAVGVSVGGFILLFIIFFALVCLCMHLSANRERKRQDRAKNYSEAEVIHKETAPTVHSSPPVRTSVPTIRSTSAVSSGNGNGNTIRAGDDIYSEINEATIGVTIIHSGTVNSLDPAKVEHQFSVRYTVGAPGGPGSTQPGQKNKDKNLMQKRVKGRPAQLDDGNWEDAEVDSPPPYAEPHQLRAQKKSKKGKLGKGKVFVPPGESGESDTDVQHNPLYDLAMKGNNNNGVEDYNY